MTPGQYYFPYLFKCDAFNSKLHPFALTASIGYNEADGMPHQLLISSTKGGNALLSIPFGATLMLHDHKLVYWETDTNLLDITELSLEGLQEDPWLLNTKIDLTALHTGRNEFNTHLETDCIVTFARKDSIVSDKASDEQFAIVIIQKGQVDILPFHWFNKLYSPYDYAWPATARLDFSAGKLYGEGMRLQPFCIDIDKSVL